MCRKAICYHGDNWRCRAVRQASPMQSTQLLLETSPRARLLLQLSASRDLTLELGRFGFELSAVMWECRHT